MCDFGAELAHLHAQWFAWQHKNRLCFWLHAPWLQVRPKVHGFHSTFFSSDQTCTHNYSSVAIHGRSGRQGNGRLLGGLEHQNRCWCFFGDAKLWGQKWALWSILWLTPLNSCQHSITTGHDCTACSHGQITLNGRGVWRPDRQMRRNLAPEQMLRFCAPACSAMHQSDCRPSAQVWPLCHGRQRVRVSACWPRACMPPCCSCVRRARQVEVGPMAGTTARALLPDPAPST